jgi:3-deoxy-manno-octulosonate cytidylyltransferase (CMP-KDO synthetase)
VNDVASHAQPPHPLRALAVVPARLGSQRLPRKMLLADTGTPLVVHTARNVAFSPAVDRVVIATDAVEIAEASREAGIEARMTRADHASGTDRVQEVAAALAGERFDVVLNVQGDEPELAPADISRLVLAFEDPGVEAATLCGPLASAEEAASPSVVKVVRGRGGDALYFSRAPIPFRAAGEAGAYAQSDAPDWRATARRHVGVYAFRPDALARFCALPRGALERLENLEQLRWLEAGLRMRVVDASSVPLGIDTRADYDLFVARERSRGSGRSMR